MSENQSETSISEPTSVPTATQDPTPEPSIPPNTFEQVDVPPEAPESQREAESAVPVNNDISEIKPAEPTLEQTAPADAKAMADRQTENTSVNEPVSVASQPPTAQLLVFEPFDSTHDKPLAKQSLLVKAREAIQFRKRKKLEKIMGMFLKQSKISNDEVEKLLHVSDATATRYLETLEKEGKIRQVGKTGHGVTYVKI